MLATCGIARAQNYVIDQRTSDALTKYLHMSELPMVTRGVLDVAGRQ